LTVRARADIPPTADAVLEARVQIGCRHTDPVGERAILKIGTITLDWSDWAPWSALLADARGGAGVAIPNGLAGVYEVKRFDHSGDERLYIGKAGDLRRRIRQGLVKGKLPHPGGARIRAGQDVAQLVARWARADRPAAAEQELHRAYQLKFGRLPEYVRNS
jgi:hypothetical protein